MNKHNVLASFEFEYLKFRRAATNNDFAAIEKWAPYADMDTRVEALENAAVAGNIECVKILVEYVDPTTHRSLALASSMLGHQKHHDRTCFDFLYPLSNPEEARQLWMEIYEGAPIWLDERAAWEQKQRIEEHLLLSSISVKKKI